MRSRLDPAAQPFYPSAGVSAMRSRLNPTAQPFYPSVGVSANRHITMGGIHITETWNEKAYRLRLEQERSHVEMQHDPSNTTSKTVNKAFPFFQLPRELRDEIYRYVLEPNKRWNEDILGPGVMRVAPAATRIPGITLLRVNQQLHWEGVECLYGENRFDFDNGTMIPFLNSIGTNATQIQHIILSARRVGYEQPGESGPRYPRLPPPVPEHTASLYEQAQSARQEREAIRGLCTGLKLVEILDRELLHGDFASMFVIQNGLVYGNLSLVKRPIILTSSTDKERKSTPGWEKLEELAKTLGWSIRNAKPAPWAQEWDWKQTASKDVRACVWRDEVRLSQEAGAGLGG